jgi:phospholipid/cholesterol/gamma-HCH transport system permease protein
MSITATTDRPRGLTARPLAFVADVGGIALLAVRAAISPLRKREGDANLIGATVRQLSWMLAMGLPLAGMVNASFGSFLAMQAYFGATFTEGAGAVVGLGLIRNVATLLVGFILAGLIAAKVTTEFAGGIRPGMDDPRSQPDRDVARGVRPDDRPLPGLGRVVLARLVAAMICGPVLALFGSAVGTIMGLLVARSMLGQSPYIFLGKIVEMLKPVDVAGLVIKPAAFAASAVLISCYEGLRPERDGGPDAFRSAFRSFVMVLVLNFTWFNLVYLTSDPYGPGVVATSAK